MCRYWFQPLYFWEWANVQTPAGQRAVRWVLERHLNLILNSQSLTGLTRPLCVSADVWIIASSSGGNGWLWLLLPHLCLRPTEGTVLLYQDGMGVSLREWWGKVWALCNLLYFDFMKLHETLHYSFIQVSVHPWGMV